MQTGGKANEIWIEYNLIVLGAGSGGSTVAAGGAVMGARVALLEHRMGGDCLNYGCIPSKALLRAAKVAHTVRTAATYGIDTGATPRAQDLKPVMDSALRLAETVTGGTPWRS